MTTTEAEPLSLTRTLRAHHEWCVSNGIPFDSKESKDRLLGILPDDARDFVQRKAIEDGVRAAFNAVEKAGLGYWKDGDVFHVDKENQAAAKPIFSSTFDQFMQSDDEEN